MSVDSALNYFLVYKISGNSEKYHHYSPKPKVLVLCNCLFCPTKSSKRRKAANPHISHKWEPANILHFYTWQHHVKQTQTVGQFGKFSKVNIRSLTLPSGHHISSYFSQLLNTISPSVQAPFNPPGPAGLYSPGGLSAGAVFIRMLYLHAPFTLTLTGHSTHTHIQTAKHTHA